MYTVGAPHTWPQIVAALVWLIDCVKVIFVLRLMFVFPGWNVSFNADLVNFFLQISLFNIYVKKKVGVLSCYLGADP